VTPAQRVALRRFLYSEEREARREIHRLCVKVRELRQLRKMLKRNPK